MRTEVFKTRAKFEEWEAKAGNCIYNITERMDDGDLRAICDVTEDDFWELVDAGIVNSEGCYYLLIPLTEKQKELLKENHGIRIIILEEELALTPKQKELVEDFNRLVDKMEQNKIGIVLDTYYDSLACFNETSIERIVYQDDTDNIKTAIDIDESLDWGSIFVPMYYYPGNRGKLHAIFKK